MQFFKSKCAITLFILLVILVDITFVESRKRPTNKKHDHNKKKNDKEDEEEEEDKKITCYQCRHIDIDSGNCTISEKECKYCFTFNATVYFEKGCLTKEQSDDVEDSQECKTKQLNNFNGTICYCDDDQCNLNMTNSSNFFVLNILNMIMSFIFLLIFV